MPQRRAGLRRTELPRGDKPLTRNAELRPKNTLARTPGPRRLPAGPKPARDTGFSPAVKLACRARAGNGDPEQASCESCGRWLGRYGGIVQHRRARMTGGTSNPVISSIVNAALQCGVTPQDGCNGLAEARSEQMNEMGFWLKNNQHPALTPIRLHGEDGADRWLTPDGGYAYEPPGAVAA